MTDRFDDVTGEALTDDARELVRRFTATADADAPTTTAVSLDVVPRVVVHPGKNKFVLCVLRAGDVTREVLRALAGCEYHADVARELERECRGIATVRVIGGGRIIRDDRGETGDIRVYGYSKTFGRVPGCNERAARMITDDTSEFASYAVSWSDDGY